MQSYTRTALTRQVFFKVNFTTIRQCTGAKQLLCHVCDSCIGDRTVKHNVLKFM